MSNVQLFNFKSNQIRVVEIEGAPWFVGADVVKGTRLGRRLNVPSPHDAGRRREEDGQEVKRQSD